MHTTAWIRLFKIHKTTHGNIMNYATVPTDDEFHDIQTSHTEHEQD